MTSSRSTEQMIVEMARDARNASSELMSFSTTVKNKALLNVANILDRKREVIQKANRKDLEAGKAKGLSIAMLDRLELTDAVIDSMIKGLNEVCALPDPVGAIEDMRLRPNGLQVGRMRVPLGVISMIYESRPNVTIDAAALCIKTGNSVILRGGSEAIHSNISLAQILQEGLNQVGIPNNAVQVVPTTDRQAVEFLLKQDELIDLVIPRGGEGLIRYVSETSRIPVLKHYKGVCHIYVDKDADLAKATPIIVNAKTHRPGVCNALEGILIHEEIASEYVPKIIEALATKGVEIRGCGKILALSQLAKTAAADDWGKEFLDLVAVMKVVDNMDEAKEYILHHGSKHTEVILTENYTTAREFISTVDASAVMVNTSTRFNDGGQLGLGTEIGISTTKLHAYGPMGLEELTTRKFVVYGQGQVRD